MIISITLDDKNGGIAQSMVSYSKALNLINENHIIILPDSAKITEVLEKMTNVSLIKIPKFLLKFHIQTKFFFKSNLKKLLKSSKYIFIHNQKITSCLKKFENKTGLIIHSGKLNILNHKGHNIFLTSETMDRYLKKFPGIKSKNIVIPHGFSKPQLKSLENDAKSKKLKVIVAGRFIKKKGFEDIIKAATMLERKNVDIQIKIYGEGPLKVKFEKLIKDLKVKSVSLCGWTTNLNKAFEKSDVLCVPSHIEPFGLVIGEALIQGLPVISTDTDGGKEILGKNPEKNGGIIVNSGAPGQLMNAIIRMQDVNLRNKLKKNGVKNINKNFSLKVLSINLKSLFKKNYLSTEIKEDKKFIV